MFRVFLRVILRLNLKKRLRLYTFFGFTFHTRFAITYYNCISISILYYLLV